MVQDFVHPQYYGIVLPANEFGAPFKGAPNLPKHGWSCARALDLETKGISNKPTTWIVSCDRVFPCTQSPPEAIATVAGKSDRNLKLSRKECSLPTLGGRPPGAG